VRWIGRCACDAQIDAALPPFLIIEHGALDPPLSDFIE
jgi:hypothetical protein